MTGKELGIFYACFSVPESAAPGEYAGTFTINGEKGALASVPVKLTVYPFKLEAPDRATHGIFYYIDAFPYSALVSPNLKFFSATFFKSTKR